MKRLIFFGIAIALFLSFSTKKMVAQNQAVDMGLSVKWASCNLGASSPENSGDYYAWGEISPKHYYTYGSLKYCSNTEGTFFTKYNNTSLNGSVDNKTRLEKSDDAAYAKLGKKWRTPTDAEWTELRENCTWKWTTFNGVGGFLVTSNRTHNSIFLPNTGQYDGNSLIKIGSYWSSTRTPGHQEWAFGVFFVANGLVVRDSGPRYVGCSIRPVMDY